MELKEIIKDAVIISENATFGEALELMVEKHTNTLLITDTEGILTGEVSVSDLIDGIIPISFDGDAAMAQLETEEGFKTAVKAARDNPIFDFMSADYSSVTPDDSIMAVAAVAIAHQRARIPVVDHEDRPVGIISRQGLKRILDQYMNAA